MDISTFGKGAVQVPQFVKDTHFKIALAAPVVDWSQPYRVPSTLIQRNQDGSSSCTAQATCYYCESLNQVEHQKNEQYSARYVYSQTNLGYNGGAYIYSAMAVPLKGSASSVSVPDGDSSEKTMTDASLNAQAIIEERSDKYAVIPHTTIDGFAQIVKDYHGFVTGFNGHDGMFSADGTIIDWSSSAWGHAVYVCGFEMHNGVKCLVFKNSWGSSWGTNGFGYMPEAFVNSGMMFDAYTYALVEDLDPNMTLTAKMVEQLQALEGYNDPAGVLYWTGKLLSDYLTARLADKIKTIQAVQ